MLGSDVGALSQTHFPQNLMGVFRSQTLTLSQFRLFPKPRYRKEPTRVVNRGDFVAGYKRGAVSRRLILTTAIWCVTCASSVAQESQSSVPPNAPSASAQSQAPPSPANPVQSGMVFFKLLQQKSLMFPDLATNSGPLSPWQKFKLAANNSVSLATFGVAVTASAFDQGINSPKGYGQGAQGYGKRFGADMARSASANLFGTFLIASALHEDPRFYVKKNLPFKASVRYAAVRLAVTRSDAGARVVNFAGLLGPLAGEGLANVYYPQGNRGAGSTFTRYGIDLSWKFGGHLLRQYWPNLNRKLRLIPPTAEPAPTPNQP
jgi:hypothetical protein